MSNGAHERRLTAVVRPEQAVELVPLQVQARRVKQRKGPVRETELGPGQIRTGAVLPLLDLRRRRNLALRQDRGNDGGEFTVFHRASEGGRPLGLLPARGERQANADSGAVRQAAVPILSDLLVMSWPLMFDFHLLSWKILWPRLQRCRNMCGGFDI